MSIFPKIQSPCPLKGEFSKYMEGDLCRMCDRRVFDLNPFTDAERVAFLSGCKESVCVSYKLRPAVAAALTIAALGAPLSVAAQDVTVEEEVILVGAIIDPGAVEYVSDAADATLIELPIIYEAPPSETPADAEHAEDPTKPD